MNILHDQNQFNLYDNDKKIGHLSYSFQSDNTITLDSTVVDPAYRGQSLAQKLLDHVIAFARMNNLVVKPVCSYTVKKMVGNPSYDDIIKK